jgi:hypothetical protein
MPSADEIERIAATIHQSCKGLGPVGDIAVSTGNHAAVLDLLAPRTRIDEPLKWESFGTITIVSKDGGQTTVNLYLTRGPDSAIAWRVESDPAHYYYGKSASEVEDALRAASNPKP